MCVLHSEVKSHVVHNEESATLGTLQFPSISAV